MISDQLLLTGVRCCGKSNECEGSSDGVGNGNDNANSRLIYSHTPKRVYLCAYLLCIGRIFLINHTFVLAFALAVTPLLIHSRGENRNDLTFKRFFFLSIYLHTFYLKTYGNKCGSFNNVYCRCAKIQYLNMVTVSGGGVKRLNESI